MTKQELAALIEENGSVFCGLSDAIWDNPELSLLEYKAAELYVETLEKLGFTVEREICGIPTAFAGKYGSGKPVIGILGEYDALSGLSQQAEALERCEVRAGGCGHGCGHNLLGAGSLAAAWAVKEYLRRTGRPGTVIFYGCPGEEGCSSKAYMAREKLFEGLDAAFCWHPGDVNQVKSGTNNSSIQIEYTYHGIASHAAGRPEHGRSALDACELLNIGVQYLREHMPDNARVHYAYTDAGGVSPNVVQPKASILYMVRGNTVPDALALLRRVDKIAEAAAMMTETTMTRRFVDGTANTVYNSVLERALYDTMQALPVPQYTPAEWDFASALYATYESDRLPGLHIEESPEAQAFVREASEGGRRVLNDFVVPYFHSRGMSRGSTDVGDVSWQTPTAEISAVTSTSGTPSHSWQNVSIGKHSIAHKGMLYAGAVMACTAVRLYEEPELLAAARAEFAQTAQGKYICPIEPDAVAGPQQL